jgi:hypothetical protein
VLALPALLAPQAPKVLKVNKASPARLALMHLWLT